MVYKSNTSGVTSINGETGSITLTSAGGTITIAPVGQNINLETAATSLLWLPVTGTTQVMSVNTGYIANSASLTTFLLPATASVGQLGAIVGNGAGGWTLAQNSGQTIHYGGKDTTTGITGGIASTQQRDCLNFICTTANTDWTVRGSIGSPNAT